MPFLRRIDDLRGIVDDRALIEALRNGDIEAAIQGAEYQSSPHLMIIS